MTFFPYFGNLSFFTISATGIISKKLLGVSVCSFRKLLVLSLLDNFFKFLPDSVGLVLLDDGGS
jgi:hypothetical protein